jgi:hypothetical protein
MSLPVSGHHCAVDLLTETAVVSDVRDAYDEREADDFSRGSSVVTTKGTPQLIRWRTAQAIIVLALVASPGFGEKPTWSTKGTHFPARCFSDSTKECRALRSLSPDGQNVAEISYSKLSLDNGDYVVSANLQVRKKDGTVEDGPLPGLVEDEILWSPDSTSLLIDGSDGGEGPTHVSVYRLNDATLDDSFLITAQRDMLASFPPCRAKYSNLRDCALVADHPEEIKMVAIDWTRGSSALVVMGEMPCSSWAGGIMCQVLGYELEGPGGKILRRMGPKEFAARWRHSMAWKFHDPGPPEFDDKQTTP